MKRMVVFLSMIVCVGCGHPSNGTATAAPVLAPAPYQFIDYIQGAQQTVIVNYTDCVGIGGNPMQTFGSKTGTIETYNCTNNGAQYCQVVLFKPDDGPTPSTRSVISSSCQAPL